ncbi:ABC transporter ATP-binding protein [Pseudonocardia phyllosphaerae]|uniref:ABC transporter ATP-binding protein n=1 Tax=Pseudonocardia phyllosphaerae TaxID=3390502 RepID=UPI00397986EA
MREPAGVVLTDLSVDLAGRTVVDDVSLTVAPGRTLCLVGPNGSGKSTLLRALLRILPVRRGTVLLDGRPTADFSAREFARHVAAVLQAPGAEFDLSVREVVGMGRAPFQRLLVSSETDDARTVAAALAAAGVEHLADRSYRALSGGERQRVVIARAFAQNPRLIVLDEPTNHLDVRHQFDVLSAACHGGATAVIALHDLNLAAHYGDDVAVLHDGHLHAYGSPAEVITEDMVREVYGVRSEVVPDTDTGLPHVRFRPPRREIRGVKPW